MTTPKLQQVREAMARLQKCNLGNDPSVYFSVSVSELDDITTVLDALEELQQRIAKLQASNERLRKAIQLVVDYHRYDTGSISITEKVFDELRQALGEGK